ncbi:TetR/AcrR family transcriptional regulator [Nocardia uniformis]|uniref:TetR/AcrR family transcriptional regulator n=1 Tax=Nocardia uniformis TaxID=53432 RepID=A0A849C984_9NOCA|nr:TetR/AcrR family transcriptional regulator [Nocardia uniformis]NNH72930.1 TetR/AcrR family transcriptional regulator [Nocardia uniformis]
MPKLWSETIEAHRRDVRVAILDTAAALVFEHGLRAVTMSQIAEQAGIGRATLYKYFPDVDAILHAWHARQIEAHLQQLTQMREGAGDPRQRLVAVLTGYAHIARHTRGHDAELGRFLHPHAQVSDAQHQLHEMVRALIADAADCGVVREDIAPEELASYCLHALTAAADSPSPTGLERLVGLTLSAMTSPPPSAPAKSHKLGTNTHGHHPHG